MSQDIFRYLPDSRIEAKIFHSPDNALVSVRIKVRDVTNNQVKLERNVQGGTIVDLTECIKSLEQGMVEAHLTRIDGDGPWTAVLHLYAVPSGSVLEVKATIHHDSNHLTPSIEFQRKKV